MTRIVETWPVKATALPLSLNRTKNQSSREEALWDEGAKTTKKYYMPRPKSTSFPGFLVGVSGPETT